MYSERWIHLSAGALLTQPLSYFDTCGKQSKGQINRPSYDDPNDISALTSHRYPILMLHRLSDWLCDCTGGRQGTETACESYHTKGEETRCQCPPEMWAPEIVTEQNKCIGVCRSTYLIHKPCEQPASLRNVGVEWWGEVEAFEQTWEQVNNKCGYKVGKGLRKVILTGFMFRMPFIRLVSSCLLP